jgi:polyhydroxyalkanoate synthesis repressor PhaR
MAAKKPRKKSSSSSSEPRIIKKYPNRRLYDTSKRAYITLSDIQDYVLQRIEFRVIDAQTEADLTRATLFQVLTEQETSNNTFFTTTLLQHMIRLYHENMQNLFSQYFEQALTQFIQQKETWSSQFEKYQSNNPLNALKELTRLQGQFWESFLKKPDKKG